VRYTTHYGIDRTADWVALKLAEEAGEVLQAYLRGTGRSRHGTLATEEAKRQMSDEIADLLGMALILADECGLEADRDLVPAIERKWHTTLCEG
jgi:NTP pyrophosphatase (non-canonical NTP hydrolase)